MRPRQTAQQHAGDGIGREALLVLVIGLLSGVLYLVVYFTQRAIYLNGLDLNFAGVVERGAPASRTRLIREAAGYYGATLALFVLYAWLLRLCTQRVPGGRLRDRRARNLALLFPVLFNLGLLFGRPYLSIDVATYIAHGHLGATLGGNPYTEAARDMVNRPFAAHLVPFGWRPVHGVSPYGPLWTHFEIAVLRVTGDVRTAILLIKTLVVAASLGSAALIFVILGRVRPADQLLGTLVYLWNPMIVVEFAAEGHNDALMIVFVLLALLLAAGARPAGALLALILGALAKYVPLILLPAQLVYFWRTGRNRPQLGLHLGLGLLAGLGLAALLYWPFWAGAETFTGVREHSRPSFLASTSVALMWFLQRTLSEPDAAEWTRRILGAIFAIYLLIACLSVRDAASFLQACAGIALVYVLVASPGYWPWYAALPLALMALVPHGTFRWMIFVLPFCSRLVAPIDDMAVNGFTTWNVEVWSTTAVGVALPLVIFLLLSAWQSFRPGRSLSTEAARSRPVA